MTPITDSLTASGIDDIVLWNNSEREDLAVYGRYAAIAEAKHTLIYVQDDDCVLPEESLRELVETYEWEQKMARTPHLMSTCDFLVANMPKRFRAHYTDSCLVGFGAIFHRDLPFRALKCWYITKKKPEGMNGEWGWIKQTADVIFTTLTPQIWVDIPYTELPWAHAENRMWKQPNHGADRQRMLEVTRVVRDA